LIKRAITKKQIVHRVRGNTEGRYKVNIKEVFGKGKKKDDKKNQI
jgi:hypothetical protein